MNTDPKQWSWLSVLRLPSPLLSGPPPEDVCLLGSMMSSVAELARFRSGLGYGFEPAFSVKVTIHLEFFFHMFVPL